MAFVVALLFKVIAIFHVEGTSENITMGKKDPAEKQNERFSRWLFFCTTHHKSNGSLNSHIPHTNTHSRTQHEYILRCFACKFILFLFSASVHSIFAVAVSNAFNVTSIRSSLVFLATNIKDFWQHFALLKDEWNHSVLQQILNSCCYILTSSTTNTKFGRFAYQNGNSSIKTSATLRA